MSSITAGAGTSTGFPFDHATTAVPSADGTEGSFDVVLDGSFTVGGKAHGGYLLATAVRAAATALATAKAAADGGARTAHPDPLAATAHYLRAPNPGPATVTTEVLRVGRSASQVRASIAQDGQRCVDVTVTLGVLPSSEAARTAASSWSALPPIDVAPRDACTLMPADPAEGAFLVSIMEHADLRLDPATIGWSVGTPQGRADLRGWIAPTDDRPVDALMMMFFLDVLPPPTFDLGPSGWVPTLSLTTYLRAHPAPGPLRVRQRAQMVAGGWVDEVCELWDSTGQLVGQATQLASVRFTDDTPLLAFPG